MLRTHSCRYLSARLARVIYSESRILTVGTKDFLLLRVLPGQRDAALLWSDHFAGTLKKQNFDRSVACPTLFRDDRSSILVVHVDDIQAAGKSSSLEPKLAKLRETYELKVEGPFLTEQELEVGDSHQTIRSIPQKEIQLSQS